MSDAWDMLLNPMTCECGCKTFEYMGFGEFKCDRCKKINLNNYGKVHKYVDEHPNAQIGEVSAYTGVSEVEIADLVQKNKVTAIRASGLNVCCKKCGTPILLGDYCESCRRERQNELDKKMRRLMGQEESGSKKMSRGIYTGQNSLEGRMRFKRSK